MAQLIEIRRMSKDIMENCKMKKWIPTRGNFIKNGENIIFKGILQQTSDNSGSVFSCLQPVPDGIVLFEDMISSGTIEATLKFDSFDKGDFAQIIFNYQNDYYFMCAGVTNAPQKYGFYFNNGQLNTVYATGLIDELPMTEFQLRVQLIGSFLELYVNGIKVLTYAIPFAVNHTQVGVWVKSKGNITIGDFKTTYKKPAAFIVSQFGDYYDVLYDEVIKPVCEELNYDPIRGDEVASCTLILNDIITSIRNSSVIIAEITPDNPNVFYEVGYAHALGKPTILLCEKGMRNKLPFDVSGFRTIFYDNSIGGKRQVEEKLKEHLENINYVISM